MIIFQVAYPVTMTANMSKDITSWSCRYCSPSVTAASVVVVGLPTVGGIVELRCNVVVGIFPLGDESSIWYNTHWEGLLIILCPQARVIPSVFTLFCCEGIIVRGKFTFSGVSGIFYSLYYPILLFSVEAELYTNGRLYHHLLSIYMHFLHLGQIYWVKFSYHIPAISRVNWLLCKH